MWDPEQYQRFSDLRSRPFFELLARVGATSPRYVLDLGCGPGNLTATLAKRWPGADVEGVDNSDEMLKAAEEMVAQNNHAGANGGGSLTFRHADVREFQPERTPDVIVSNAVLQWIPNHRDLLPHWAAMLAPDGWLAIQMPANYDAPTHEILQEVRKSPPWRERLGVVPDVRLGFNPGDYLELLVNAGCEVDAWETTYLHVMPGEDPVLEWYKGTAFRPIIAALPPDQAAEFLAEVASRLRAVYPARSYGTVLPFRRVFVVARRNGQAG
jgi:trans-aconitate 2-methyltransferase